MEVKLGIIGIFINKRYKKLNVPLVNKILSEHSDIILARLGLHVKEKKFGVISLIVEGDTDKIGSLTGKLGDLKGVTVRSMLLTSKERVIS